MLFGSAHAQILQRRRELQARSRAARLLIAQDTQALQRPLAVADQLHAAGALADAGTPAASQSPRVEADAEGLVRVRWA